MSVMRAGRRRGRGSERKGTQRGKLKRGSHPPSPMATEGEINEGSMKADKHAIAK